MKEQVSFSLSSLQMTFPNGNDGELELARALYLEASTQGVLFELWGQATTQLRSFLFEAEAFVFQYPSSPTRHAKVLEAKAREAWVVL